jgi:hypothetical protein
MVLEVAHSMGVEEDDRQSTPEEEKGSSDVYGFEDQGHMSPSRLELEEEEECDTVVHSASYYTRVAADMCHCRSREVIDPLVALVDEDGTPDADKTSYCIDCIISK